MNDDDLENVEDSFPKVKPMRVASVIDQYQVVLNVGENDGIRLGQTFLIYAIGNEIMDPETGESLGALELVRGRGKVQHLQPNMCTIHSIMQKEVPGRKKIYRREKSPLIASWITGDQFHEVEEAATTQELPFDDVIVGDYARKLN